MPFQAILEALGSKTQEVWSLDLKNWRETALNIKNNLPLHGVLSSKVVSGCCRSCVPVDSEVAGSVVAGAMLLESQGWLVQSIFANGTSFCAF